MAAVIASGDAILFTGAGFSSGALDTASRPLPDAAQMRVELWHLLFGDDKPAHEDRMAEQMGRGRAGAERGRDPARGFAYSLGGSAGSLSARTTDAAASTACLKSSRHMLRRSPFLREGS
jgi:hypothetical protein